MLPLRSVQRPFFTFKRPLLKCSRRELPVLQRHKHCGYFRDDRRGRLPPLPHYSLLREYIHAFQDVLCAHCGLRSLPPYLRRLSARFSHAAPDYRWQTPLSKVAPAAGPRFWFVLLAACCLRRALRHKYLPFHRSCRTLGLLPR